MARGPRRSSSSGDLLALSDAAREGRWPPVAVLAGAERFLIERAVGLLRAAVLGDGPAGFNDDVFHGAPALGADRILSAARTLPMMAPARFVLARDIELAPPETLDALVTLIEAPIDTSCVVLTATKLDGRSRLTKAARKAGVLHDAAPLKGAALRRFARAEATRRGHRLEAPGEEALLLAIGEDLAALDDALERLSLFVGEGAAIGAAAVEACVSRLAVDSIWSLVDAVGARDLPTALGAAGSLLGDREPALRILALLSRQLRMVARMRAGLAAGLDPKEAARDAGAPPFKARELATAARRFPERQLRHAFQVLAETDLALKGSKRPSERVLEEAVVRLCAGRPTARERIVRRVRTYR
ncbi:MAG: DNA polymerase III subunit delta [Sandaracinaceae bacterium]